MDKNTKNRIYRNIGRIYTTNISMYMVTSIFMDYLRVHHRTADVIFERIDSMVSVRFKLPKFDGEYFELRKMKPFFVPTYFEQLQNQTFIYRNAVYLSDKYI